MNRHIIFGVHISGRVEHIAEVQKALTEHGCNIRTRLGLHDVSENYCSPSGVLVLDMFGNEGLCNELFEKLNAIEGVEAQKMVFDH